MKKTKTVLAFLLAALLLLATAVPAFAAGPRIKTSGPPAQAPYKAIEMPTDASPDVDWDAVMDGIWNFMFVNGSGSSYDLSQYHIPATDSNKNYIFSVCNNSPRFLHIVPRLSWFEGGDLFAAIFTNLNVAANRAKYDACVSAMDQLLYGIKGNNSLSDVDKCLLVHDRLAAWVAYDTVNLDNNSITMDAYSPYGPLALHSGVCNGYALAYNWMLEELGFTTYYTSSDKLNHGWSKVKLNGQFYYVDVTWDDPTEDIPGKVSHNQFLLSGSTCSARHHGETDFDMTPDDTRYESYITDHFGSEIRSEIVLIGNKYYYFALDGSYCYLTSRDVNGGIESAKKLVKVDHWVTSDDPQYLTEYYPTLAAIGTTVLYTNGRAVYAYDTTNTSANYEPTVCYTPGDNLFPEDYYFLRGIQQTNGTVSVTAGPASFSQSTVANYTESFVYCTHPVTDVLSSTPGPDCQTHGDAELICTACRALIDGTGQGPTGAHSYTAQTVKAQALKTPATCTRAATYYYSCSGCGMVENNAGHTFTSGSPSAHIYTAQTVKAQALKSAATCQSPAVYYYSCANCGAVEKSNSHTFTSGSTSAHSWQWIEDKAATCSAAGTKHEECSVCHTKRNENTAIPATGNHAASGTSLVGKVDPSCTANGYSGDTVCKGCGTLLSKGHTENALGHTAPNSKGDCSRCGVHLKDVEPDNGKPAGDCKYCGETHTGLFGWLTKIIHSILALFGLHK